MQVYTRVQVTLLMWETCTTLWVFTLVFSHEQLPSNSYLAALMRSYAEKAIS